MLNIRSAPFTLIGAVLAILLLSQCGGDTTPTPTSGIDGTVTIGPTCPVETVNATECAPQLFQATITVFDSDGDDVATVASDKEGHFRVALPPGEYTLVPEQPNPGAPPSATEQSVTVYGTYTHVSIEYDSGIR
ncbi:MAG: carboxypeptidase-like regulatory domain-containing protein [Dehalococcoidia bacterium]